MVKIIVFVCVSALIGVASLQGAGSAQTGNVADTSSAAACAAPAPGPTSLPATTVLQAVAAITAAQAKVRASEPAVSEAAPAAAPASGMPTKLLYINSFEMVCASEADHNCESSTVDVGTGSSGLSHSGLSHSGQTAPQLFKPASASVSVIETPKQPVVQNLKTSGFLRSGDELDSPQFGGTFNAGYDSKSNGQSLDSLDFYGPRDKTGRLFD